VVGECDGVGVSTVETRAKDTIPRHGQRENEVKNKSKITNRGGEVDIEKSRVT